MMRWPRIQNPIRGFAVLCVAAIAIFIMRMRYLQLQVLSSPDWCNRAMKAEQLQEGSRLDAALACVGLQTIQIKSIATNSLVDGGSLALCLIVLIVVVVAGGKLSFAASKSGLSANMGREDVAVAKAVDETVAAAEQKADEIKAEPKTPPKFTAPPGEEL